MWKCCNNRKHCDRIPAASGNIPELTRGGKRPIAHPGALLYVDSGAAAAPWPRGRPGERASRLPETREIGPLGIFPNYLQTPLCRTPQLRRSPGNAIAAARNIKLDRYRTPRGQSLFYTDINTVVREMTYSSIPHWVGGRA